MGSEYFINSQTLEDKIRTLLPSQGGAGAGFDLSASTQIIPIIDVTESAEGSNLRVDLQTAMDFATSFNYVVGTTTTLVTTTGFFRVFGTSVCGNIAAGSNIIFLDDGSTQKTLFSDRHSNNAVNIVPSSTSFDFIAYLSAGISLKATSDASVMNLSVATRQIASIDGTLTNPLGF